MNSVRQSTSPFQPTMQQSLYAQQATRAIAGALPTVCVVVFAEAGEENGSVGSYTFYGSINEWDSKTGHSSGLLIESNAGEGWA